MNSPWTVIALALVILLIEIVTNQWNDGILIALLILILVGAIFPPFAIGFSALILLYLVLRRGPTVLKQWGLDNSGS